ncbi:MAG TPA: TonB-dependent receptor [Puia sp.]|nr:TonB-dependent receptor [Puia sp.]
MRKHLFNSLFFTFWLISGTQAQSRQQKLTGIVIDSQSGSPLSGVSILIQGQQLGTRTDADGRFFIPVDQEGPYNVSFSSVGYQPKLIQDLKLSDGENLSISLDRSADQLENVVVIASAKKETTASLYQLQKSNAAITDGISAETIKKSPDKNTGEVLKRVSGASVQENRFVVIRGMSERYNVALLNNSLLPSTEPDKKAFSFNIIPSSLVDNVVIYKSPTPDLPGDFSGGAVKIVTRDYPSRPLGELSLYIGFNTLTTGKNFYKGFPNGSFDAIGFFDDSRLIPGAYARNEKGFVLKSPDFKREVTKTFPNTFGDEAAYKSLPSFSVSYAGGNTHLYQNGNKLGYIYSLGYSNGRAVSNRERLDYPIDKTLIYDYRTTNYDQKNNLSALLNLTYSYRQSRLSLKTLFNNDFVKTMGERGGKNVANTFDPFYIKSQNSEAQQNGIANAVLEGVHHPGSSWTINWNGSFGYTYRNQPDQRVLTFRADGDEDAQYYLRLSNENSPEIRNAGRVYSFMDEFIYGANVDATKSFKLFDQVQKLKFGTANIYRDRSVDVTALGYASLDQYGTKIAETKSTTFNTLFSPENIDLYNLTVANIETNSTNYDAHSLLNAGFVMLDNRFSEKLRLSWGLRVEKYQQELTAEAKNKVEKDNVDLLSSFILTWSPNHRANLRLAGSQAVNRPEFRELADYSVFDYDNYFVVKGNPNLVRARNTNADLRYEWFPGLGEIISASVFYKYFINPIEQTNLGNDVLSYENADKATVYGVEFEVRKKLNFISGGFFSNLTFYANAAYIKGSVQFDQNDFNSPMQGQSPYILNGGLTWSPDNNRFSVNLLYNRIGPRLRFRATSDAALNVFEKPRDVLDFQISKKIFGDRCEIKLTISDLLAQPASWYYKFDPNPSNINYDPKEDKTIISIHSGASVFLTLKYNFLK